MNHAKAGESQSTDMNTPFFTVFTPTYNRAHTLHRVYNSLLMQTFRDFEWLIVDDGSTDNTRKLIKQFIDSGLLNIRYFYQKNQGKHFACNIGIPRATGELFIILDSDDYCLPHALASLARHWNDIDLSVRHLYASVACLGQTPSGQLVGNKFPSDVLDGQWLEVMYKYRIRGDKWVCYRTDILRNFPFPTFAGEKFIAEGVVWNRISEKYLTRFVNEPLLVIEYLPNGLSANSLINRIASPEGTLLYYYETMLRCSPLSSRIKAAANMWRFALHSKEISRLFNGRVNVFLHATGAALGILVFLIDLVRLRRLIPFYYGKS